MLENLVITTLIAVAIPSFVALGAFRMQSGARPGNTVVASDNPQSVPGAGGFDQIQESRTRAMPPIPYHKCRTARVEYIQDCCTLLVRTKTEKLWLRLHGIDCPGNGQHWGDVATRGLNRLIGGRKIAFEQHATDQQGRSICTIYVRDAGDNEWLNVNTTMLVRGYAWVRRQQTEQLHPQRRAELNRMENWARERGLGVWGIEETETRLHWDSCQAC